MNEATMDAKGRIVIPEEVRKELGLNEGSRIRLRVERRAAGGGPAAIVTRSVGPDEFIKLTEGALKKESRAKATDPLLLKGIWVGE